MSGASVQAGKRATYPAYKPSGMDWVGDIPEKWEVHRLKHIASVQFSSVDKHTKEDEAPVRLCNYVDVYYNDFIREGIDFMTATATRSEIDRFQLRYGDVLITKDSEAWDDIAVPAYVAEELDGVLCGYHLAHISPDLRKLIGEYLFRAFRSRGINDQFRVAANGITRFGLGKYWLDNGLFLVPPLEEQKAIAAFLDREIARIDALIEKKQRQIVLLQEKRLALITHAVTKGLDPNAKLKDSGIEWLGHVPMHWKIARLGYYARVFNGSTPSRNKHEYWIEGTIPWLSSGKVNEDVIKEQSEWITEVALRESSLQLVPKDSVVIGIVGQGRTRGTSALMGISATINQNMAAVVPTHELEGRFLHLVFQHMYGPIREYGRGANQAALNCEQVADLKIPLPPKGEQLEIVDELAATECKNTTLRCRIEKSISLLSEYRTALISAAVTGKIDVRKEAHNAR
jgi:type I restriction enzyme S subunit